jgi:membrane protease YdiL (CAAX protease family)
MSAEGRRAATAGARTSFRRPMLVAVVTTILVTALSYGLPEEYAATGVGFGFLAATWWMVLRHESAVVAHHGLSLGGLFDPEPLSARRLTREAAQSLGWAALIALIVFPFFWVGYLSWWQPRLPFTPASAPRWNEDVLGQLLVIALPEEAFYRGYLQTAFDDAFRKHTKLLGARVGPGLLVSAALFALGHVLTKVDPNRLAVFFPALLFGWLRARTGGIGAPLALHAMSNLFADYLARSYGFH